MVIVQRLLLVETFLLITKLLHQGFADTPGSKFSHPVLPLHTVRSFEAEDVRSGAGSHRDNQSLSREQDRLTLAV